MLLDTGMSGLKMGYTPKSLNLLIIYIDLWSFDQLTVPFLYIFMASPICHTHPHATICFPDRPQQVRFGVSGAAQGGWTQRHTDTLGRIADILGVVKLLQTQKWVLNHLVKCIQML